MPNTSLRLVGYCNPATVPEDGFVRFQSDGNDLYVTMDGTDPRLPGGGVAPLGPSSFFPASCRGSGSTASLDGTLLRQWSLERFIGGLLCPARAGLAHSLGNHAHPSMPHG